jgi:hypothetical protein
LRVRRWVNIPQGNNFMTILYAVQKREETVFAARNEGNDIQRLGHAGSWCQPQLKLDKLSKDPSLAFDGFTLDA